MARPSYPRVRSVASAVDRADHRIHRGRDDVRVDPDAPVDAVATRHSTYAASSGSPPEDSACSASSRTRTSTLCSSPLIAVTDYRLLMRLTVNEYVAGLGSVPPAAV